MRKVAAPAALLEMLAAVQWPARVPHPYVAIDVDDGGALLFGDEGEPARIPLAEAPSQTVGAIARAGAKHVIQHRPDIDEVTARWIVAGAADLRAFVLIHLELHRVVAAASVPSV